MGSWKPNTTTKGISILRRILKCTMWYFHFQLNTSLCMDTMKSVDIKPNEEMYKFVYLKPCMETKPSQKFEFELINLWKFGIKMLTAVGNSEFRAWHDPLKPSKLSFLSEKITPRLVEKLGKLYINISTSSFRYSCAKSRKKILKSKKCIRNCTV